MLLKRVLAVVLLGLSPVAFADSLDINMNNNAAAFKYGATADFIEGNAELQAGILYNDANNMLFEAGLMVKGGGEEDAPGLSIGVGAKGVFGTIPATAATNNSAVNGSAIAVGGSVTLAFPTESRVAIVGEYFASPKIMSFADAERFNQFGVRLEIGVSPQANVYVGYREIGFGVKTLGGVVLDKGTHAGVLVLF